MIRIEPTALYTRESLAELLEPAGLDVDLFIARLKPKKVFRVLYFGEDLLAALRAAPALAERDDRPELPAMACRSTRRHAAAAKPPGSKLDAYAQSLKGNDRGKSS